MFHPLKFMLASPAEDAAEIIARLGAEHLAAPLGPFAGVTDDLHDVLGRAPLVRRERVAVAEDVTHGLWKSMLFGLIIATGQGQPQREHHLRRP